MARIACLGLGAMGRRMAARLAAAGHEVTVWNRTAAAADGLGLATAATPRAAVARAEVVLGMLADDAAARAVWLDPDHGAAGGMAGGALAIEQGTLTPGAMRALAAALPGGFLDAPVLGSRPQAEAGALIHLIGGGAEDVARAEPVLAALGTTRHHMGPTGAGAVAKLLANALFAVQAATLAELSAAAAVAGFAPEAFRAVFATLPVLSPAGAGLLGLMVAGRDDPLFPIDLVEKDLRYAATLAPSLPMTAAAHALFARAQAEGLGGRNISGVRRLYP